MLRALVISLACLFTACGPGNRGGAALPGGESCDFWGGRGYSLTVRSGSSHAHQFREFGYDDATGVVRVHDSDLFATGVEASQPRVIERTITLAPADRDALSRDLTARCPSSEERTPADAMGGGSTWLEVRTAAGNVAKARFVKGSGADVARKSHQRLQPFFPELRAQ